MGSKSFGANRAWDVLYTLGSNDLGGGRIRRGVYLPLDELSVSVAGVAKEDAVPMWDEHVGRDSGRAEKGGMGTALRKGELMHKSRIA